LLIEENVCSLPIASKHPNEARNAFPMSQFSIVSKEIKNLFFYLFFWAKSIHCTVCE